MEGMTLTRSPLEPSMQGEADRLEGAAGRGTPPPGGCASAVSEMRPRDQLAGGPSVAPPRAAIPRRPRARPAEGEVGPSDGTSEAQRRRAAVVPGERPAADAGRPRRGARRDRQVAGESATAFMRRAVLEAAGPVARTRERLTTSTAHQIAQGPSGAHAGAAPV